MTKKKYGIRITLPPDDFLNAPHLLGEGWEGYRWYDTADERDRAYADMLRQPPFYRRGETPSQVLEKVERED
jgi:hypothetical protein